MTKFRFDLVAGITVAIMAIPQVYFEWSYLNGRVWLIQCWQDYPLNTGYTVVLSP